MLTILRFIAKRIFNLGSLNPPRKMWSKKNACKLLSRVGFKNFHIENLRNKYICLSFYSIFSKTSYIHNEKA